MIFLNQRLSHIGYLAAWLLLGATAAHAQCFASDTQAFENETVSTEAQELGQSHLGMVLDGNPVGWYRQADLFYNGKAGLDRDYDRTIACLEPAIDAGYDKAHYLLGVTLQRVGRGEEALAALQTAQAKGHEKAELQIAFGHLRQQFGTASDATIGFDLAQTYAPDNQRAQYFVAQALGTGVGTKRNMRESFVQLHDLASNGYLPAMDRMGRAYTVGLGTPRSLPTAIDWYQKAIAAGNNRSEFGLAQAYIQLRDYAAAKRALERAVAADVNDADYQLARAHSMGRLGRLSDYSGGWDTLTQLAGQGHLRAAQDILVTLGRGSGRPADIAAIETLLLNAGSNGDVRSIEALVRFYRERPDLVPDARSKRAALLDTYGDGISPSASNREAIRDGVQQAPARAWQVMYDVLRASPDAGYVDALLEIRRISRNGYLYAIQRELAVMGRYNGAANGILTTRTLRAILDACRTDGRAAECNVSPLSFQTVRILGEHIVAHR